jgi:hypothetical protein
LSSEQLTSFSALTFSSSRRRGIDSQLEMLLQYPTLGLRDLYDERYRDLMPYSSQVRGYADEVSDGDLLLLLGGSAPTRTPNLKRYCRRAGNDRGRGRRIVTANPVKYLQNSEISRRGRTTRTRLMAFTRQRSLERLGITRSINVQLCGKVTRALPSTRGGDQDYLYRTCLSSRNSLYFFQSKVRRNSDALRAPCVKRSTLSCSLMSKSSQP